MHREEGNVQLVFSDSLKWLNSARDIFQMVDVVILNSILTGSIAEFDGSNAEFDGSFPHSD